MDEITFNNIFFNSIHLKCYFNTVAMKLLMRYFELLGFFFHTKSLKTGMDFILAACLSLDWPCFKGSIGMPG